MAKKTIMLKQNIKKIFSRTILNSSVNIQIPKNRPFDSPKNSMIEKIIFKQLDIHIDPKHESGYIVNRIFYPEIRS